MIRNRLTRFRPGLEPLEDRSLPSVDYVLSGGVLSRVVNGTSTPILSNVQSFALDNSNDVFALQSSGALMLRAASAASFTDVRDHISAFGLDLGNSEVIAVNNGTTVSEAPISPLVQSGSWQDTVLGSDGWAAPADGSFWFLEPGGQGDSIFQLKAGQLTQMPGTATAMAGLEGLVYLLDGNNNNQISWWTGTAWSVQPSISQAYHEAAFLGIASADRQGNHALYQWQGGPSPVAGIVAAYLAPAGDGTGYVQDKSGRVWGFNASANGGDNAWHNVASVTSADGSTFFTGLAWSNLGSGQGLGHDVGRWANGSLSTAPFGVASSLGLAGGAVWAFAAGAQVWGWNGTSWVQQATATAADGSTWFLGLKTLDVRGDRAIFYFALDHLGQAPGMAAHLSAGGGTVNATNAAGSTQHWSAAPSTPPTVSAADGSVLTLVNGRLWRQIQPGTAWQVFYSGNTGVVAFQLDTPGTTVYWLTGDGTVRQAGVGSSSNYSGLGVSGVVAPDGSIWFLGTGFTIDHIQQGQLAQVPGSASWLAVIEKTVFTIAPSSPGQVSSWNGSAFVPQPTSGAYFLGVANADGHGDHTVYQWFNGVLTALTGHGIALTFDDDLYVRDSAGQLWGYNQTAWTKVAPSTLADGSVFFLGLSADISGNHPAFRWVNGSTTAGISAAFLTAIEGTVWAITASNGAFIWNGTTWVEQPGVIAADGSLWLVGNAKIDAHGDHAIYRFAAGKLVRMPGAALTLLAGQTELAAVDAANRGWTWNMAGGAWQAMTGVSAADGSFWYLGNTTDPYHERTVYHYAAGVLQHLGSAARLALVSGLAWQTDYKGLTVMQWNGTTPATLVSARTSDGTIYVLGSSTDANGNHPIYRWAPGGRPALFHGAATGLLANGAILWQVNAAGLASIWNGKVWLIQSANVQQLAAAPGGIVYALETNGSVLRLNGVTWTVVAKTSLTASDGKVWFLDSLNRYYLNKNAYAADYLVNGRLAGAGFAPSIINAGGTIWIVDPNGAIFYWNVGQYWTGPALPDNSTQAQWVVDGKGNLFVRTHAGDVYLAQGTGYTNVGVNTARIAIDSAGELVMVGPTDWGYYIDGISLSGGTVNNVVRYALDAGGNLFSLWPDGTLDVQATSGASTVQIATGVTQMGANADGQLVALFGPFQYSIYDAASASFLVSGGGTIPMAIDAQGRFFALQGTTLYVTDDSGTQMFTTGAAQIATDTQDNVYVLLANGVFTEVSGDKLTTIGRDGVAGPDGSGLIWYLGPVDSFGKQTVYQLSSTGPVTTLARLPALIARKWLAVGGPAGGLGSPDGVSGQQNGTLWAEFAGGAIYANSTHAFAISGAVWQRYQAGNQSLGVLGLPISDFHQDSGFGWQSFTGGAVYTSSLTGTYAVLGNPQQANTFLGKLVQLGTGQAAVAAAGSRLGLPLGEVQSATDINGNVVGKVQYFQNGALFSNASGQVIYVSEHIALIYQTYRYGNRALGTALQKSVGADGAVEMVQFTNGAIYWSPTSDGRVLADDATLTLLQEPLDTASGTYLAGAWNNTTAALQSSLNQDFGIHTSAQGVFSMNLIEATAYANVSLQGFNFNSDDLAAWMNDEPVGQNIDPLQALTSLAHANVVSHYPDARFAAYGNNDQGSDAIYFSSAAFVDWASPQTFSRLTAEYESGYLTDLAVNEVEVNLEAEGESILAWAIRRFGGEMQAVQALGLALGNGDLQMKFVPVEYDYTVLGQTVKEQHVGFEIVLKNLTHQSLAPQPTLLTTDAAAMQVAQGVASGYANTTVINLGKEILNAVLGTDLDPSEFDFQGALLGQVVKVAVYNRLFQTLDMSANVLDQAWAQQGDPVLDLMKLAQAANWDGPTRLENSIDSWLHRFNGDLSFHITGLWFNTSTYELSAQITLDYDHDWGTFASITQNIGTAIYNWGQTTAGHAQNWFKKEAGILAQSWDNWNQDLARATPPLPTLGTLGTWAAAAANNLQQVMQNLDEPVDKLGDMVGNIGDKLESSTIGTDLGELASGQFLGLVDNGKFIAIEG